jgi:hypothetical protein
MAVNMLILCPENFLNACFTRISTINFLGAKKQTSQNTMNTAFNTKCPFLKKNNIFSINVYMCLLYPNHYGECRGNTPTG